MSSAFRNRERPKFALGVGVRNIFPWTPAIFHLTHKLHSPRMHVKIGEITKKEIRRAIEGCTTRAQISAVAADLASRHSVSKNAIYDLTREERNAIVPPKKARSDKGRRAMDINTHPDLQIVAGWVLQFGITPALAILMAKERGMDIPITFTTLVKYLRENGLDKRSRANPQTPHVRFEAKTPGEYFQFDISGLKTRWLDLKSRRIVKVSSLDVSTNHPNTDPNRVRVWRFVLKDDFSRRCFVRYVGVDKPSSSHVFDFLLQAYAEMGVPLRLYTDNDRVIKSKRNQRASAILHRALEDQGGYESVYHMPGNSRATGKVERHHQITEQDEKIMGVYIAEGRALTVETLNTTFAIAHQNSENNRVHSETGAKPMERWLNKLSVVRSLDYNLLKAAFLVDEFEVKIRGDLTIRVKNETYQLPTGNQYPFGQWINQKVSVAFPDDFDYFTLIGLDGLDYDIVKEIASPVAAGEYRAVADTRSQTLRNKVIDAAKADAKRIKQLPVEQKPIIPFFDTDFAPAAAEITNIARFPKAQTEITPERIAEVAPDRAASAGIYKGAGYAYWKAFEMFKGEFQSEEFCKQFLDTLYTSRNDKSIRVSEPDIREALAIYMAPASRLRAVS